MCENKMGEEQKVLRDGGGRTKEDSQQRQKKKEKKEKSKPEYGDREKNFDYFSRRSREESKEGKKGMEEIGKRKSFFSLSLSRCNHGDT